MSALTLKIFGVLFMTIDHIGYIFPDKTSIYFRVIGRIAAPIFFYLFVESYIKTSNKVKYFLRLLFSAISMYIINILLFYVSNEQLIEYTNLSPLQPNIFVSFVISFLILVVLDKVQQVSSHIKKANLFTLLLLLIGLSGISEYAYIGPLLVISFYIFYNYKYIKIIVFSVISIFMPPLLNLQLQSAMIASVFLLLEYNGEKGVSPIKILNTRAFFYIYYVLHLVALFLLANNL